MSVWEADLPWENHYLRARVRCEHATVSNNVVLRVPFTVLKLSNINRLVFIIEMDRVHCAVQTGSLSLRKIAKSDY